MSRIGKKPILIPDNVEIRIDGQKVFVKGPKGELTRELRPEIEIEKKEGELLLGPKIETKKTGAFWGLERALLNNMVEGVSKGYEKSLEIRGLGYKAAVQGNELSLELGFSHTVKLDIPQDIEVLVKGSIVTVSGADKARVGQMAAKIRRVKKPEPYKGTGMRYLGEVVKKKVGKRVATAG